MSNTTSSIPSTITLSCIMNHYAPGYHYAVQTLVTETNFLYNVPDTEVVEIQLSNSDTKSVKLWKMVNGEPTFIKPSELMVGEVCGWVYDGTTLDILKDVYIANNIHLTKGFFTRLN